MKIAAAARHDGAVIAALRTPATVTSFDANDECRLRSRSRARVRPIPEDDSAPVRDD